MPRRTAYCKVCLGRLVPNRLSTANTIICVCKGNDMLYCHYELFTLNTTLAGTNIPTSLQMMKLKFSSSNINGSVVNFRRDGQVLQQIVQILKQIPAGKRSYDDTTNIWTVPFKSLDIINALLSSQIGGANQTMFCHVDLDAFLNPPAPESKNKWSNVKVKTEKPEDFFYKPPTGMDKNDIIARLTAIVMPYMAESVKQSDGANLDKEFFMRAYKITARKLHPDLGGDPAKMSELNQLWMQYKEMV